MLQVDVQNSWTADPKIILYYDDDGTRVPVAVAEIALTDDMQTYSLVLDAVDAPDAVGKQLDIKFNNVTEESGSWLGLDNVHLYL